MTPEQRTARAQIAAMRRHHPNAPSTEVLAQRFKADRLEEYIRRVVDSAPPLSPEQRDRLALLLREAGMVS